VVVVVVEEEEAERKMVVVGEPGALTRTRMEGTMSLDGAHLSLNQLGIVNQFLYKSHPPFCPPESPVSLATFRNVPRI
jgi:hypothetical protein